MVDQDFSRIGEIFYRDIGDEEQVSLEGFIKKALTTYAQKFMVKEFFGAVSPKRMIFPSSKGSISFIVKPYYNKPDLSSLELTTKTEDAAKILQMLRGDVTAEFLGLDIKTIEEHLRKKIINSRKKDYAQVGDASFYFSLDPQNPDLLKRVIWNRVKSEVFEEEAFYAYGKDDDNLVSVVSLADRISIKHSFYIDNNPNMGIIKESCDIKQPSKRDYRLTYVMSSANEKTLPAGILKHLKDVFEITRKDFDQLSYQRAKIEDINNSFVGGHV